MDQPIRQAFISGGVAYQHGLQQPGEVFADFERIDVGRLHEVDLDAFDLVVVPRSADGEVLRARRYQFARFLDRGGVLVAFGELWANWFPGCRWEGECPEDIEEPVIASDHPLLAGLSAADLHWHPSRARWCCHGHLEAPPGAEVLVQNVRGDAWMYVDRVSTNGVILASSNIDPDTHTYHGSEVARGLLERMLEWARAEAARATERRSETPKIAGFYSGVHFQRSFYEDEEFAPHYAVLPAWELAATDLHRYAALWIPRESNQDELLRNRAKLEQYVAEGGTLVSFDEVNQPWLPLAAPWALERPDLDSLRLADHPIVAGLTVEDVRWHSHGSFAPGGEATAIVGDGEGRLLLLLGERPGGGRVLAGTIDPDCHAGFGTEVTRPLLRGILRWLGRPGVREQRPAEAVETA